MKITGATMSTDSNARTIVDYQPAEVGGLGVNGVAARYPYLAQQLYNTPLVIDLNKADALHMVLQGHAVGNPPPVDAAVEYRQTNNRAAYPVTAEGVAVIQVLGSLMHRALPLEALSGLTSYQRLDALLSAAASDSEVKGILLDVDSPGGGVHGLFDLAAKIRRIAEVKPVWGIANESAMSGGYAILSAADRVIAPETSLTGSIGVVMLHLDMSKANDRAGRKYTPIIAGHRKVDGASFAPLSEGARDKYQSMVNTVYDLFTGYVERTRPMSLQSVIDTQADIYQGIEAEALGLIDEIGTFEETVLALGADLKSRSSASINLATASHSIEGKKMSETDNNGGATGFAQADLDAAREQGRVEGREQGMADERARVSAIVDHQKAGANFAQAANAIKTGLSVEQAQGVLDAMPEAAAQGPANDFAKVMTAMGNPDVSDVVGSDGVPDDEARAARAVSFIQ